MIVLILLAIAYNWYKDSVRETIEGIRAIEDYKIVICCFIAVIFFLLEGYIIANMAKQISPKFKWINGFKIAYLCEFFRILTLGSGSGVAAIYYMTKNDVPAAKGTGLTLMQFGIKKVAILILGIIGFVFLKLDSNTCDLITEYNTFMLLGAIFTTLVALVMMGLAFSRRLNRFCNWVLDKLSGKFKSKTKMFEGWREKANQLNETGLYIIHYPKLLICNIVADMLKFSAIYIIPSYILVGNCSINILECVMLIYVISMVDVVIPVPSGIGSFEYLFVLFFKNFAQQSISLPAVLVYRFATWIVPFFVGMIIWIIDKLFFEGRE